MTAFRGEAFGWQLVIRVEPLLEKTCKKKKKKDM